MENTLIELGFTKNEATIYLTLLDIGLAAVTKIAEHSKIHRTNVYDALERLVEKGLATYIFKEDTKYFEATDPENLINLLKDKEVKLKSILPQLLLKRKLASNIGEAHVFEGLSAFTRFLDSLLKLKSPILVYGIPRRAPELMKTFIPHFHERRIKLKIPMLHIYNFNAQDRVKYLNTVPYTEAKYMVDKFESKAHTLICGNQVNITLWIDPIKSIQIINEEIADSYREHFNIIWKHAKKV